MNKFLKPKLNKGEYVFVLTDSIHPINEEDILCLNLKNSTNSAD